MGATLGEVRMTRPNCVILALLAVALVLGVGTAVAQDSVYDIGYFTNNTKNAPTGQLRLTNDGDASGANLCANIYVFNNAEEMQECCSCEVTANGYLDIAEKEFTSNILDGGTIPTRGIVKEVSSWVPSSGTCSPTAYTTQNGIKGWLTNAQKLVTVGAFTFTETPLLDSSLSFTELSVNLQETCSFVLSLGTGTGVCNCADAGD
jgi:hypothetical protein